MKLLPFVILGIALAAGQLAAQQPNAGTQATIGEIITGLQKSEQAVQTLSVSLKSKIERQISPVFAQFSETASVHETVTEKWHVEVSGAGWNRATVDQTTTNRDGKVRHLNIDHHATFDGKNGREITIETYDNGHGNQRGSLPPTLMRRGVSPFDFTTQHQNTPVSEIIRKRNGQITGQQQWDGHDVTVVEVEPVTNNSEYKSEFWIDPARDYVVVRRLNSMRKNADQPWHLILSVDSYRHQQIAGVWLPGLAWKRGFDLPPLDQKGGRPSRSYKAFCSDWKVNTEIPDQELTLEFPPGLKVNGMLEAFQANQKKSDKFFVDAVKTELQRKLIGREGTVAYASIDATTYVDVNTHQITPARFDFDAFKKRLKEVHAEADPGTILLHFDFGAIGTDDVLGAFAREPVSAICKEMGFQKVRVSSTYHNDGKTWQPPEALETDRADENNLGDDRVSVFAVRTRLSRSLAKGTHCLIELNQPVAVDSKALLDEEAMETIENALAKEEFDGATVHVKAVVGSTRSPLPNARDLPHMRDDSDVQLAAVKFLRSLGFKDIRLTLQNGFSIYTSFYPMEE